MALQRAALRVNDLAVMREHPPLVEGIHVPRAGLTTMRVVEEAENVADEFGLENLTLAAVAPRLGVRMPSLYRHVAGIDELRRLMSIQAKSETADVLARAAAGKAGAQALAAVLDAWRSWAKAHPGRYAATVRAPDKEDVEDTDVSNALLNIIYAALAGYRLEGDDAVNAVRLLRANFHGFVNLERAEGFKFPNDIDHSFELLVGALDQMLRNWPPATIDAVS
jgi:AcrR family transcriptional regulator